MQGALSSTTYVVALIVALVADDVRCYDVIKSYDPTLSYTFCCLLHHVHSFNHDRLGNASDGVCINDVFIS